jgi:sulfur carrier protein ThiS adenylyltransferase
MSASQPDRASFERELALKNVPGTFQRLQGCTVGLMGAGGLGSNAAAALARAGVGRLILADHDRVEISNLNRQFFFTDQVGERKVKALEANLLRINPYLQVVALEERVTPLNMGDLYGQADLMIEALDRAREKAQLIQAWMALFPDRWIVAASGLAGMGKTEALRVRKLGRLVLCGDEASDADMGLCAARVMAVAAMEANVAIELLMEGASG